MNRYRWIPFAALLILLALAGCNAGNQSLDVGDKAPDFTLPTANGGQVSLSDYTGEQPVLLFFHMAVG